MVFYCLTFIEQLRGTGPECGSLDVRNSVVKIVSDDNKNALVNYAVKNSSSVAAMVDLLGHASFGTTEKYYIMSQSRMAGRALARVVSNIGK